MVCGRGVYTFRRRKMGEPKRRETCAFFSPPNVLFHVYTLPLAILPASYTSNDISNIVLSNNKHCHEEVSPCIGE